MNTATRTALFHKAFGHPVRNVPQAIPDKEEAWLAFNLIAEELQELADALFDRSVLVSPMIAPGGLRYKPYLTEVADAIGDLDVVVNGAGLRHGLDMDLLSEVIFDSNMSKLGVDGKPIYSRGMEIDGKPKGKIMKGPNFSEPDIEGALDVMSQ